MQPIAADVSADKMLEYRARAAGALFGIAGLGLGYPLGELLGVHGRWLLLFCPFIGLAVGYLVYRISRDVAASAAAAVGTFVFPSGSSVPYEPTHSYEQSLAARGDVASALTAYESRMLSRPDDLGLRSQAAELYATAGNARRAAELLLAVRCHAAVTRARELYSTQRLIDLYLGPLNDTGRAMVEMRRLTERYPRTAEAKGAVAALARLKLERRQSSG